MPDHGGAFLVTVGLLREEGDGCNYLDKLVDLGDGEFDLAPAVGGVSALEADLDFVEREFWRVLLDHSLCDFERYRDYLFRPWLLLPFGEFGDVLRDSLDMV